ncbi:hypothetical protein D3P09_07485 [Paenibacillus pinisoli]|uniref:SLH domain-containing protein n=1 Tax=Paenibacillus pinisoli TaxID=1276110 RepID=A0A3A6PZX3_9BACL|nr:MBG domain-containing protein [Paenibacillus pinisoli]RJX39284.1 hypothetical protein D3P09_07485 [Paenibacillus pinisoli]
MNKNKTFQSRIALGAVQVLLAAMLALVPVLAALPELAAAADLMDQTSGAGEPEGTFRAHGMAQSFTAGTSGYLNRIDLYMVDYGNPNIVFTLRIYAGQSITGPALASATFSSSTIPYNPGGWTSVFFTLPAQVQAGQQYTMFLTSSIGDSPQTVWKTYTTDVYAGGKAYRAPEWFDDYDMGFATYVGPEQRDYTTSLTALPITGTYGQSVIISAELSTPEGPLADKRVQISIDGNSIGYVTTNASGKAAGSYSLRLTAGTYPLKLSLPASNPYSAAEYVTTLTVNKAPLTVTPNDVSRPYGSPNGNFSASFSGLMAWDTAASIGQPVYSTAAHASSPVGNYNITIGGLNSTKYTITYSLGTLSVTPVPLTVTAADQIRVYGQPNPVLTGSISGLVNNDTLRAAYSTSAIASSPAGTYRIVPSLSDPDNVLPNYAVTIDEGELTVTKAELRVTTDPVSRWADHANPPLKGSLTGVAAGDSITAQYGTSAEEDSPAGEYDITAQLADPLNRLNNYEIIMETGKLTVYGAPEPVLASGDTANSVKSNIGLPGMDAANRPIRWTSSDNSLLDAATGEVHRPVYSAGDSVVTLEAAVDANQTTYRAMYQLTIARKDPVVSMPPVEPQPGAYIDFVNENNQKERISFPYSEVNSGLLAIGNHTAKGYFELSGETVNELLEMNASLAVKVRMAGGMMKLPLSDLAAAAAKQYSGKDGTQVKFAIYAGETVAGNPLLAELKSRGAELLSAPVQFKVVMSSADGTGSHIVPLSGKAERHILVHNTDATGQIVALWNDQLRQLKYVPVRYAKTGELDYALVPGDSDGIYVNIANRIAFSDMQDHWAKHEAEKLASMLIFEGKETGVFDPGTALTRAETAALLVRALGIGEADQSADLSDIGGQWYEAAVASAASAGLVTGYEDGSFRPNDAVTREQLAVIIARAIAYSGRSDSTIQEGFVLPNDWNDVSGWAAEAVNQMLALGIVKGDHACNFNPQHTATRAEAAAMLSRLLGKLGYI